MAAGRLEQAPKEAQAKGGCTPFRWDGLTQACLDKAWQLPGPDGEKTHSPLGKREKELRQ
jgi:hypothetical protein